MIQLIRAQERYTASHGWLTSRFSFSFAEYYDPQNVRFGVLRVFNDDTVQAGEGFGRHPHADMEIMTYVIDGALEHQDSMGNIGVLRPGEVQRMTAGTGVYHSEYNHSKTEPVHFLQLWFLPNKQGLTPSWEQAEFTKEQQRNTLLPVVSGRGVEGAMHMNQDVTVFLSNLEKGLTLTHTADDANRLFYVFVIRGILDLNGELMHEGDAARISDVPTLTLSSPDGAEFMLIDLV
ncbi:pirin family protein [Tumebacillus sp. ITR2]|uniref:Pirin family protein n=1 Tax=Tumebacillus amylolyticus TaxID=2801339 RepID=A0ABS1J9E7_9BACL|nr:pirin family protein [Tumebacillus amylolyticus]MBL0386879.1 pirin family protein [Tumebacillus amylolyticus]